MLVKGARKARTMKYAREFITSTVVGGLFIVVPVYLAALLLLKGMKSVANLVRPFAVLVPDWIPAERLFSLVSVLALCFRRSDESSRAVGTLRAWRRSEWRETATSTHGSRPWSKSRTRSSRLHYRAAQRRRDGLRASVPTPLAGPLHPRRERVHFLDVPFTQGSRSVSRWGSGSKELVAAMRNG